MNTTALGNALSGLRALLIEAETPDAAKQAALVIVNALVERAELD